MSGCIVVLPGAIRGAERGASAAIASAPPSGDLEQLGDLGVGEARDQVQQQRGAQLPAARQRLLDQRGLDGAALGN
jgi:hypothetical protein